MPAVLGTRNEEKAQVGVVFPETTIMIGRRRNALSCKVVRSHDHVEQSNKKSLAWVKCSVEQVQVEVDSTKGAPS